MKQIEQIIKELCCDLNLKGVNVTDTIPSEFDRYVKFFQKKNEFNTFIMQ